MIKVLGRVREALKVTDQKRAGLDELFKALLHKLITGETRVNKLDLSVVGGADGFGTRGS